ncbi:hypothetical protein Tco_0482748 [Tanacetum coccineum]
MNLKNFLHVHGNHSVTFSTRLVNALLVVGSPSIQAVDLSENEEHNVGCVRQSSQNVVDVRDDEGTYVRNIISQSNKRSSVLKKTSVS